MALDGEAVVADAAGEAGGEGVVEGGEALTGAGGELENLAGGPAPEVGGGERAGQVGLVETDDGAIVRVLEQIAVLRVERGGRRR